MSFFKSTKKTIYEAKQQKKSIRNKRIKRIKIVRNIEDIRLKRLIVIQCLSPAKNGNKKDPTDSSRIINASGCWEEFEIARDNKNIIIPIGSTGFMAKKIFDEVRTNMDNYKYLENYMDALETENDVDKLVDVVIAIVKEQYMA